MRKRNLDKYLGPEDHLHIGVCTYLRHQYSGCTIHHSPNEGKRGPVSRYKITHMGVSAGFPDLLVIYRGKVIAIELKAGKNKPTEAQLDWLLLLNAIGITAQCCTGFESAKEFIDQQFKPLRHEGNHKSQILPKDQQSIG